MAEVEMTLRQWGEHDIAQQPLCINYPVAANLELKSGLVHLLPTFRGLEIEDPHQFLKEFHVACVGIVSKVITKLGAYKNDMIGMEFDGPYEGEPKLSGESILTNMLGISLEHSKWWDLAMVIAILIFYRLLFFTILKLKEKATPMFRKMYAKRTLQHMKKRPYCPSKRHQAIPSLSSQEGLNSPLY